MTSLSHGFNQFMQRDFKIAVSCATLGHKEGKFEVLELFENGDYRVISLVEEKQIKHYKSAGVLIKIPHLSEEDWDDDPDLRRYSKAANEILFRFREAIEYYLL